MLWLYGGFGALGLPRLCKNSGIRFGRFRFVAGLSRQDFYPVMTIAQGDGIVM